MTPVIALSAYFAIAFAVIVLGRAWQHTHPEEIAEGLRQLSLILTALLWPIALVMTVLYGLWLALDKAILWVATPRPPKPPRPLKDDPKAGYRDAGKR